MVRHFSFTELVAYKLGTRSAIVEKLDAHLRAGCPACEKQLAIVAQLIEASSGDKAAPRRTSLPMIDVLLSTPQSAVRHPNPSPAQVCTARLVFDSRLQPVAAGLRAGLRPDRHSVYAERELLLDINIERDQQSGRQSIIGQVQSNGGERDNLGGLPVLLLQSEKMLMGTHTNPLGEFVFEKAPQEGVTLCLVCSNRQIRIPCPLPDEANLLPA